MSHAIACTKALPFKARSTNRLYVRLTLGLGGKCGILCINNIGIQEEYTVSCRSSFRSGK